MFHLEWEFVWWKCHLQPRRGAQTQKGRQGNLNNTLSQLLLECPQGAFRPMAKMSMWTRLTGMQGRDLWDYMKVITGFLGRKGGINKEGYGNSLAVWRGTGRGLCVFVWVLSMSVMVCVTSSVCLYGTRVFACAPVGNMGSAWLLDGPGHVAVAALPQFVCWAWYSLHTEYPEEIPKYISYNALCQTCKVHLA